MINVPSVWLGSFITHTRARTHGRTQARGGGRGADKGSDVSAHRDEWTFEGEAAHAGLNTQGSTGTAPALQGCIVREREKCLRPASPGRAEGDRLSGRKE